MKIKRNYARIEEARIFREAMEDVERLVAKSRKLGNEIMIAANQERIAAQKGTYRKGHVLELSQQLTNLAHDLITKSLVLDRCAASMGPEEM